MKTQALAQIPETEHADGHVVRLSDVVKVYKAGDVEVSAIKGITFDIPRQRFSMIRTMESIWILAGSICAVALHSASTLPTFSKVALS